MVDLGHRKKDIFFHFHLQISKHKRSVPGFIQFLQYHLFFHRAFHRLLDDITANLGLELFVPYLHHSMFPFIKS